MEIDGQSLSIDDVLKIAREKPGTTELRVSPESLKRVLRSRRIVEESVKSGRIIYGITTGFGANAEKTIPVHEVRLLQRYLILSHSAGVGEPAPPEVVRAAMLIRLNSLAKGFSGVRPLILETIVKMLDRGVTPVVPLKGSVGASGDLAPLSHIALTFTKDPRPEVQRREKELLEKLKESRLSESERHEVLRLGEAYYWQNGWIRMPAILAMEKAGIERITLEAKEGLALNNGTAFTSALAIFAIDLARKVFDAAIKSAVMSIESIRGFESAFNPDVMRLRGHRGQVIVAEKIKKFLEESRLVFSEREVQSSSNVRREFGHVQDAYSIRCIPQVYGPVLETLELAERWLNEEINGVTDNPVILPDADYPNRAFSAGNFHAEYLGLAMDYLKIAFTEIGNMAERRIFRLLDKRLNRGLPMFLAQEPGLMNGLMLAQYTAASLASENKILAHPATADTIPTSANREDHVSMAPNAALKAIELLKNVARIIAIEFLVSYRALKMRKIQPGRVAGRILKLLDTVTDQNFEDHVLSHEIERIAELIEKGTFL